MFSIQKVQHVAQLARIALTSKEEKKFQKELSSILNFVKKLKEADVVEVNPVFYSVCFQNVMQEPEVENKTKVKKLISLMPETKENYLKVKKVF